MVHTAAGYAKAMNRRATLACSSSIGPGATNMVTGAALATINRLPVLLLPSDYYATPAPGPGAAAARAPDLARRERQRLLPAGQPVLRPHRAARAADRVAARGDARADRPGRDRRGHDRAAAGRAVRGLRLAGAAVRAAGLGDRAPAAGRPRASPELVELLRGAERPFIIAGGGVHYSEAWDELAEFAEAFGIPVGETSAGKGAFRGDRPPAARRRRRDRQPGRRPRSPATPTWCICVGTRLTDFPTGSHSLFQHPEVRFASINVDGHDAHKLRRAAGRRRRARGAARRDRRRAARPASRRTTATSRECRRHAATPGARRLERDVFATAERRAAHPGRRCSGSSTATARAGDTIVAAAGSPPGDLLRLWDCTGGRNAHLEFGYSCMGYEIPASLGVRLAAARGREVYTFIGDGTYLMNPTELATAVQEGLKITVLISKNDGFQCIRDLQLRSSGQGLRQRVPRPRSAVEPARRRLRRARPRGQRRGVRRPRLERRHGGGARGGARRGARRDAARARSSSPPTATAAAAGLGRVVGRRAGRGLGRRGHDRRRARSTSAAGRSSGTTGERREPA